MILALLRKDLHHHGPVIAGFCLLMAAGLIFAISFTLIEQMPTLLSSATGFVYYGLPVLTMFVNRRLVVLEREDGTHELFASLPVSPVLLATVRYVLGLVLSLIAGILALVAVAALVSRHELVSAGALSQLALQIALYTWAWQSVCFGVGHLGRYRWVVWLGGVPLVYAIGTLWPNFWRVVMWQGVLVDPLDDMLVRPPWSTMPAAILWGLGGLALALWLVRTWGGALPRRWFGQTHGRERAVLVGVIALCWTLSTVLEHIQVRPSAVESLEAGRARIAVVAAPGRPIHAMAREAVLVLDSLGEAVGVESWPQVVVVADRHLDVAVRPSVGREPLALRVNPDAPVDEVVRGIVTSTLIARTGGFSETQQEAPWVVRGAAAWWRGDERGLLVRRAALARGRAREAVHDASGVVASLGPQVAEALAWAGLMSVERTVGREAVLEVLRTLLRPSPSATAAGAAKTRLSVWGDWVGRATGMEPQDRIAAWERQLGESADVGTPLGRAIASGDRGTWRFGITGPVPEHSRLAWTALDPLEAAPRPDTEPILRPITAGAEVRLLADPRSRIATRLETWREDMKAWEVTPWQVHTPAEAP